MKVVLVVPTYNERDNILPLYERFSRVASAMGAEVHLLFVDDGSPDGTWGVAQQLVERDGRVHLLERGGKKGLGTAYQEGFRHAIATIEPSVFVQMDADLQHPPEKLPRLVQAVLEGADVVVGSRYVRGGSFLGLTRWRQLVSMGANWMTRVLLGLGVSDATSGFKALNRRAVDALLGVRLRSRGFIFQVESLFIFKKRGLTAVEVPYVFEERSSGASKMSGSEIWEFVKGILLIRLRRY